MNYRLKIEKRVEVPRWLPLATSVGSVILAFLIGGVLFKLVGGEPIQALKFFYRAVFGSWAVFSDTMVKATPLIIIGVAVAVAFKMRLWNIGAEGQFYAGAFGASLVVLVPLVPEGSPKVVVIGAMMIMGMLCGGLVGLIPGYLRAKYKVNEIITTLMLNYILINWNNFWIFDKFSDRGFQMTPTFDRVAWLPRLADYAREVPAFSGVTLHLGVLFGVVAAAVVWWIFKYSRWGYEIKLYGDNPQAARYAGIDIQKNIILVMVFSGALAGLAGMAEISGVVHRLQESISPGYGFTAIIVAWLAKLEPFVIIPVSILFAGLIVAGRELQPSGLSFLLQGIILFMLISSDVLLRYKFRIVRQEQEGV